MMKGLVIGMLVTILGGPAAAQQPANPAARTHVRFTNGVALKYTSKLARLVELNFTFGNDHLDGKKVISAALDRIAKTYALDGKDAFAIRRIASGNFGAARGELPPFTLTDLLSGEVMVTNNIGYFNQLPSMSAAQAAAFETAVRTEGRGVLGFHGSGDGGAGWKFYAEELHPVAYDGHGGRVPGTVYRNEATRNHLVLQGILELGTILADVPMGVDGAGQEVIAKSVKTRRMTNEWYKFGRNLSTDAAYKTLVTPLLKYDPRGLASELPDQFRYKGGNLYTFHVKVGAGKVAYVPAGHDNTELMAAGTTFDGGTGDFDRYLAQSLFYLAGYKVEVCTHKACQGLPLAGADELLTGATYDSAVVFSPRRPGFAAVSGAPYEATLSDVSGSVVARRRGLGRAEQAFDEEALKPGIYFLKFKQGKTGSQVRRYLVPPPGP